MKMMSYNKFIKWAIKKRKKNTHTHKRKRGERTIEKRREMVCEAEYLIDKLT